jgi:hypothetical protein
MVQAVEAESLVQQVTTTANKKHQQLNVPLLYCFFSDESNTRDRESTR